MLVVAGFPASAAVEVGLPTVLIGRISGAVGVLESHWTVDNGGKPHEATHYLTKAVIGRPVVAALAP